MLGWIINLDFAASADTGGGGGGATYRRLIDANTIDRLDVVLGQILLLLFLGGLR
jgi:hypothetical protein